MNNKNELQSENRLLKEENNSLKAAITQIEESFKHLNGSVVETIDRSLTAKD